MYVMYACMRECTHVIRICMHVFMHACMYVCNESNVVWCDVVVRQCGACMYMCNGCVHFMIACMIVCHAMNVCVQVCMYLYVQCM